MKRRLYKPIWLFLALLFAGQSLLPVAALAEVSVRCVGAPASAKPCAEGTFAMADMAHIAKRFAGLACCRNMAGCTFMTSCATMAANVSGHRPAMVMRNFSLSAPKCLVSISPFRTASAITAPSSHRWMLRSAPALAPPAFLPAVVVLNNIAASAVPHVPFSLFPRLLTASHGLRAPPAA